VAASAYLYANVFDQAFSGKITWGSDTLKVALLTSSYTPDLVAHVHYSDLTNEVANGNGYTTGGVTLGTIAHTVTAANSFATTNGNFTNGNWSNGVVAAVGDIVKPATPNGYLYKCVVAGTTGASSAVLNAGPIILGNTITDGGVTWSCFGRSITQFGSANAVWTSSTIAAAYAVLYDATPATAGTQPLIALQDFGGTVTSTNSTYTVPPPALGWFRLSAA